jgi:hypothetical protein
MTFTEDQEGYDKLKEVLGPTTADRLLRVTHERLCELLSDGAPSVVDHAADLCGRLLRELRGGGPSLDDRGRELAPEVVDVPGQLGKTEVDDTMELAHLIAELLNSGEGRRSRLEAKSSRLRAGSRRRC